MTTPDSAHAWWSRLRHQGLLLSPVVMIERYPQAPPHATYYLKNQLREANTRFASTIESSRHHQIEMPAILASVDTLIEKFIGHQAANIAKQNNIPEKYTLAVRIGSRSETIRPHRILFTDESLQTPALLVMADTSPQIGRGRGRNTYARFLELLRGTGHRLGLLTNGQQFRLIYAGLDFESWCEWESDRWFDDGEGTEELLGLRQLLSPESLAASKQGVSGLLDAIEESRKRQADLSSVLRENVRQAVELLLEEVSTANRSDAALFTPLVQHNDRTLSDTEAHEALLQATVRVVMRLVVCLFAESRGLLPVNDPIYLQSYGVRTLYELLDEATRYEGGTHVLFNRQSAWPRLMALFRLIHGGSDHGSFPLRPYGGALFRPGEASSSDPVSRALHILEHKVQVGDDSILYLLRKLLRGPLPVLRGRSKTFVEGPVDYTELRTEFIGLIYEGLLDYRLKRTDEQIGPQVFLNIGREPVLPLSRLTEMLATDRTALKNLLTTLKKETVTASASEESEETDEEAETDETEADSDSVEEESVIELDAQADERQRPGDYLDSIEAARAWAREAVILAGLARRQARNENDSEYSARIETEAKRLIKRVVANGEFYLVRAGNTRKGTGTFYTRPQLAVPTVHRTLEPLCYDKADDGTLTPKTPETILGLKVCDPACGSASFLVAALHYLTEALYKSLIFHCRIDDPAEARRRTLPFGRVRTDEATEDVIKFPPDDPHHKENYEGWVKTRLRRHIVERCIYGVDINPLAVELARVSLWVETLDAELPFSFLDHKVKVGNALVGCWLDRVEDYPLKAWEREGGDGKDGPRTQRIETMLKGEKIGNRRSGDGRIKREMRELIDNQFKGPKLFPEMNVTPVSVVSTARADYERLHELPVADPDERERYYREKIQDSPALNQLKQAMDEWCSVWFWPTEVELLSKAPTPNTFHNGNNEQIEIIENLAKEIKFFHWELAFPDVFTPNRQGFDALLGNPPWDVMKPNSQEFFSDYDPLYRTYDKQTALSKQKSLYSTFPQIEEAWGEYNARFKSLGNWVRNASEPYEVGVSKGNEEKLLNSLWKKERQARLGFADAQHPFRMQGIADLNSYKMFAELFWGILQRNGRLGVILPTGIYSDSGTKELRASLLFEGRLDFLYAFQNEKRVFAAAHHSFKQVVVFATKGGKTAFFRSRFRMGVGDSPEAHEIPNDILHDINNSMTWTPEEVQADSPKTLSVVEIKSKRDQQIFRKSYVGSSRIGDQHSGLKITSCEFHMTNDSKLFSSLEKWKSKGYNPDEFGRWLTPQRDLALPIYQGGMIHHFDPSYKSWITGMGRSARWSITPTDNKQVKPKFCMSKESFSSNSCNQSRLKLAFRNIARSTDSRTLICSVIDSVPCGNSLSTIRLFPYSYDVLLGISSCLHSLTFDYLLRTRLSGVNLSLFILEECPIPNSLQQSESLSRLVFSHTALAFNDRRFAPEWLVLKHLHADIGIKEWKQWWAVTEADRLRLRVEIEAHCARLYGLDSDDFDWIVRDDPKDPKGF
jgi:hypothetical protein